MDDNIRQAFIKASIIKEKTDQVVGTFNKKLDEIVKSIRAQINAARDHGQFCCTIIRPDPVFYPSVFDLLKDAEYTVMSDPTTPWTSSPKWIIYWK
jgi:hypothetical protein